MNNRTIMIKAFNFLDIILQTLIVYTETLLCEQNAKPWVSIMKKTYTNQQESIVTYGFDQISDDETVEVNLKDLMYVFSTLQEFQRFFHQPTHYPDVSDVHDFFDADGYRILQTALHDKLAPMLPKHIDKMYDEGVFDCPTLPFYYAPKAQRSKE